MIGTSSISFTQSRQSLFESTGDLLAGVMSNITDVVFNMTDIVVASVVIGLSKNQISKHKNNIKWKYIIILGKNSLSML